MPRLGLPSQFRHADGRPRRAAYALPTLFTAGNVFLGFLSVMKSFEGSLAVAAGETGRNVAWEHAAVAIGIAFLLDGLDGRIARMTNTTSEFGKEMDSLADMITFCLAPAVLAVAWGVQFVAGTPDGIEAESFRPVGYFVAFLYVLCGAARLARFNITTNPVPKNPGRPDRKYFVGLATPAAAGVVASIVYASSGVVVLGWALSLAWMLLVAALAFLMVSTWRYRSFKDLNLMRPRSPLTVVLLGALIFLIWNFSKPVLLGMALAYVSSGIVVRVGGLLRRWLRPRQQTAA